MPANEQGADRRASPAAQREADRARDPTWLADWRRETDRARDPTWLADWLRTDGLDETLAVGVLALAVGAWLLHHVLGRWPAPLERVAGPVVLGLLTYVGAGMNLILAAWTGGCQPSAPNSAVVVVCLSALLGPFLAVLATIAFLAPVMLVMLLGGLAYSVLHCLADIVADRLAPPARFGMPCLVGWWDFIAWRTAWLPQGWQPGDDAEARRFIPQDESFLALYDQQRRLGWSPSTSWGTVLHAAQAKSRDD
jgi:hypothetical protein